MSGRNIISIGSQTHSFFRDLIDGHASVWTHVSLQDTWPSQPNIRHFERAAKVGNHEALIKLGIAYLYNEGLPGDFEGKRIFSNGEMAADMFCRVESLQSSINTEPFTWLFFRPPWSTSGACCKQCVFNNMKNYVQSNPEPSIDICIVQTLQHQDVEDEAKHAEILAHLDSAIAQGSTCAAYLKWQHKYETDEMQVLDKGGEVQRIRELRDIAQSGSQGARLALCKTYAKGRLGTYTQTQAAQTLRDFIQSALPTNISTIFLNKELTPSMRFILVDWLVEVAHMKDFENKTLHVAISVVDRYLQSRQVTRSKLQLVGVAAMVLCSRFLGEEIITIREAAWLTDNTYKYEEVVRMMGEITAALRGKFRVMTSLDYVEVIGLAANNDPTTQFLSEYICELVLLHSELSHYSQGLLAAASVLLARLTQAKEFPWSACLEEVTGLSLDHIRPCIFAIHDKCFATKEMVDHRNVTLQAVKVRYDEEYCHNVSSIEILDSMSLQKLLGVAKDTTVTLVSPVRTLPHCQLSNSACKDLIASPSRSQSKQTPRRVPESLAVDQQPRTPSAVSIEVDAQPDSGHIDKSVNFSSGKKSNKSLNESTISGYDGDKEDEGESFLDMDEEDTDLESLWCVDKVCHYDNDPDSHNDDSDLDALDDSENQLWFSSQPASLPASFSIGNISAVSGSHLAARKTVPSTVTRRSSEWRQCKSISSASSPSSASLSSPSLASVSSAKPAVHGGPMNDFSIFQDNACPSTSEAHVGPVAGSGNGDACEKVAKALEGGQKRQALGNLSNLRQRLPRPPMKRRNTEQAGNRLKTHIHSVL